MNPIELALIDTIVTLELASDDVIDLDFEVETMESIAAELQRMTGPQRDAFVGTIMAYAKKCSDPERKKLMLQMPSALGLVDDDDEADDD